MREVEKLFVRTPNLDEFYPTFVQWSEKRGFPTVHRDNVEEIFVCYYCGIPLYSCFVWNTNSKMCLIGFPVGNPDVKDKKNGLVFLFKEMSRVLKERGYKLIWTTSATKPVIKALTELEFVNADPNVSVYIRVL